MLNAPVGINGYAAAINGHKYIEINVQLFRTEFKPGCSGPSSLRRRRGEVPSVPFCWGKMQIKYSTIVLRGLRRVPNWASIMPREALSDRGCKFFQSGTIGTIYFISK